MVRESFRLVMYAAMGLPWELVNITVDYLPCWAQYYLRKLALRIPLLSSAFPPRFKEFLPYAQSCSADQFVNHIHWVSVSFSFTSPECWMCAKLTEGVLMDVETNQILDEPFCINYSWLDRPLEHFSITIYFHLTDIPYRNQPFSHSVGRILSNNKMIY